MDEQSIDEEAHRIFLWESHGIGAAYRFIIRFLTRTVRVVIGLIFAGLALWAGTTSYEGAQKPFAAQSLAGIAGVVFLGWLAYGLAKTACIFAFGHKPTLEDETTRRRVAARERLAARESAAPITPQRLPPIRTRKEPKL